MEQDLKYGLRYGGAALGDIPMIGALHPAFQAGDLQFQRSMMEGDVESFCARIAPCKARILPLRRLTVLRGGLTTMTLRLRPVLAVGKLSGLLPTKDGKLIVTRGRLGEKSLEVLLGVVFLPILTSDSRLTFAMVGVHCNHSEAEGAYKEGDDNTVMGDNIIFVGKNVGESVGKSAEIGKPGAITVSGSGSALHVGRVHLDNLSFQE